MQSNHPHKRYDLVGPYTPHFLKSLDDNRIWDSEVGQAIWWKLDIWCCGLICALSNMITTSVVGPAGHTPCKTAELIEMRFGGQTDSRTWAPGIMY